MTQELLPCPFCGGAAEYYIRRNQHLDNYNDVSIHCYSCRVVTAPSICQEDDTGAWKEQQRVTWNTRATVNNKNDSSVTSSLKQVIGEAFSKRNAEEIMVYLNGLLNGVYEMPNKLITKVAPPDKPCLNCLSVDTNGVKKRDMAKTLGCLICGPVFKEAIETPSEQREKSVTSGKAAALDWFNAIVKSYMQENGLKSFNKKGNGYIQTIHALLQQPDDCKTCNTYAAQGLEMINRLEENKAHDGDLVKALEKSIRGCEKWLDIEYGKIGQPNDAMRQVVENTIIQPLKDTLAKHKAKVK